MSSNQNVLALPTSIKPSVQSHILSDPQSRRGVKRKRERKLRKPLEIAPLKNTIDNALNQMPDEPQSSMTINPLNSISSVKEPGKISNANIFFKKTDKRESFFNKLGLLSCR